MRAKMAATGEVLERLARRWPTDLPPRREYADIVLAAPSNAWPADVAAQLEALLPPGARVDLDSRPLQPGHHPQLPGFAIGCHVWLPGVRGAKATRQVWAALAGIDGLDVDYSRPLDLLIVSPGS